MFEHVEEYFVTEPQEKEQDILEGYSREEIQEILEGKKFPIARSERTRLANALRNEAAKAGIRERQYLDEIETLVTLIKKEKAYAERCSSIADQFEAFKKS